MTERRNTMGFFGDGAADLFAAHIGSACRPPAGSKVNHRARDYLAMPRVAFAGGFEGGVSPVLAKHPDMILLNGGSLKGAEFIAARWAGVRKVPQVVFKPGWTRHAKAATFKRN